MVGCRKLSSRMIAGLDDDPDHLTAADRECAERRQTRLTECRPSRRRTTRSRTVHRGSDPGTRKSRDGAAPEDRRIEVHDGAVGRREESRSAGDHSDAEQNQAGDPPPSRQRAIPDAGSSTAPAFQGRGCSRHNLLVREAITPQEDVAEQCRTVTSCGTSGPASAAHPPSTWTGGPTAPGSQPRPASRCWARRSNRRRRNPAGGRQLNPRGAPRLQNVGALVANGTWVRLGGAISSDARPRRLLHCGQLRQQSGNKLQMAPTTPGHSA